MLNSSKHRCGNAVVVSLGFITLCAMIIAVSSTSSTQSLQETSARSLQMRALAAVEAVLQRREAMIARMAQNGTLLTWTGETGQEANFGEDVFDICSVRWKIEPARTMRQEDINGLTDPDQWWISNPSPDTFYQPIASGEQPNEHTYLFRVAAEARVNQRDPLLPALAVAQGQRYVAINEEPLFRYVIFYAKNGPQGDLELSHGPGVSIAGGVYSNGAIYLGSGTQFDWNALSPSFGAAQTLIGPDSLGRDVPVIGVDGIFRLSKPINYAAFNDIPVPGTAVAVTTSDYSLDASIPGDRPTATLGNFASATSNGNHINPYRILGEGLTTTGPERFINGTEVLGRTSGTDLGNDSRDFQRPPGQTWQDLSLGAAPTGFGGIVRTRLTNARVKNLPRILRDRPFEAQRLFFDTATDDPDDDLDEHLEARPIFLDASGNETTNRASALSPTGFAEMESPGQYVRYALGTTDAAFVRKTDMTGWAIRRLDGTAVPGSLVGPFGLMIRERPIPDTTYLSPAQEALPAVIANRNYLPFAYGKHLRPSIWPFTETFVSDRGRHVTTTNSEYFGRSLVAVDTSGSDLSHDANPLQWYDYGGSVTVMEGTYTRGRSGGSVNFDDPGYHRNNWRLIHLKNDETTRTGTSLTGNTNASGFYFPKAEFRSFQARIVTMEGGQTTTNLDGRKAGLMLRSVDSTAGGTGSGTDLIANGFNGRQAFAAMLFSPERGFHAQRRRTPSNITNVNAFYTGITSQGDGLSASAAGGAPDIHLDAEDWTPTEVQTISYTTSTPQSGSNAAISTAEGAFTFRVGPYSRNLRKNANSRRHGISFQVRLIDTHNGEFFSVDDGKVFRIYNNETDTTASWTSGTGNWSNTDYVSADQVRFTWDRTITTNGTTITRGEAKRVSDGTMVATGANTIIRSVRHYNSSGSLGGTSYQQQYITARNAAIAAGKTEAQFIAALEAMGYIVVDWSDANYAGDPAFVAPAYPAYPALPTNPMATSPRPKFSLERSSYIERNSWISARGTWFSTAVDMNVPDNGLGALVPTTNAFEPRYWTGATAPVLGDLVTDADGSIVPNTTGGPGSGAAWEDAQPTGWTDTDPGPVNYPWVRIELSAANTIQFKYYFGPLTPPADHTASAAWANWELLRNPDTAAPENAVTVDDDPITEDISSWTDDLLIGLCAQSGNATNIMRTVFDQITLARQPASGLTHDGRQADETISWEVNSAPNDMTRYLCSQYQVFFGPYEITEDFFLFGENLATTRLASENWFYNTREFWSQSRWWNEGEGLRSTWIEKETGSTTAMTAAANVANHAWRRLFARSVALDLNLGNIQDYLAARSLTQATTDRIADGTPAMPAVTNAGTLGSLFSGLFYAARTNRYPWNPTPGVANPFNPLLPNTTDNYADLTMAGLTYADAGNRAPLSPSIKPQDFHHPVMISNGATIDWALDGSGTQPFGTSKTSIATPNQLVIRGSLNSNDQQVNFQGTDNTPKTVPLAIMGDQITLLSDAWTWLPYQSDNLSVNANGLAAVDTGILDASGVTLSATGGGTQAVTSTYRAAIVTNNLPTTRQRVLESQGAPFINTMLYLENWGGQVSNYTGSLVVLDTCRNSRNFLLQEPKNNGRTPFGTIGFNSQVVWGGEGTADWATAGVGSPAVYAPPMTRNMTFNEDLLTEEGTPPNTPFGLTAVGIGGWSRVIR